MPQPVYDPEYVQETLVAWFKAHNSESLTSANFSELFAYADGELVTVSSGVWSDLSGNTTPVTVIDSDPPGGGLKAISLSWIIGDGGSSNVLQQFANITSGYSVVWTVQGKAARNKKLRLGLVSSVVGFTEYDLCQVTLLVNGNLSIVDANGTTTVTVGMTDDAWHDIQIDVSTAGVITLKVDGVTKTFTGAIITTNGSDLVGFAIATQTNVGFNDETGFAKVGRLVVYAPTVRPDLSANLQTGRAILDEHIIPGTPANAPLQQDKYPAIWVSLAQDREDWSELGGVGTKRMMVLDLVVWCAATSAPSEGHDLVEQEMKRLARNVKDVLRIDPSLGHTPGLVAVIPTVTEFNALLPGNNPSTYVSAAKIGVQATYMSA